MKNHVWTLSVIIIPPPSPTLGEDGGGEAEAPTLLPAVPVVGHLPVRLRHVVLLAEHSAPPPGLRGRQVAVVDHDVMPVINIFIRHQQ